MPTLIRRAAATTAVTALVLLLTAPAALAHDRLKSSSPADKAKIERLETIELEFTARMTRPTVLLEDSDGEPVPVGEPRLKGVKVFADPEEELEPGRYRIAWRVVSSDGHPIQGELRFTVTEPKVTSSPSTAEAAPTTSETPASPSPTAPASAETPPSPAAAAPVASEEGASVPGWIWIAVGALVLGGVAIFVGGRRRSRDPGGA
ncbi:copper resistance CopC family protein [Nonomuraea jiangxiensis]|uniref:copper resistance CopC family protein n=1 Tax=Nonomuraea jiangxiensis TaxID=633440 RepID=UPI00115FE8B9|nr:copper resistance protein CopC [Nonomuraea jiangxiensis]